MSLDDLAFDGAELTEAELGEVAGGRWSVSWTTGGKPSEWVNN
ncbi:putative ATP-grasp target RiPP [Sphaerisporangium fuscum]